MSYQAVYDAIRSRFPQVDVDPVIAEVMRSAGWDISYAVASVKDAWERAGDRQSEPFALLRPKMYQDGNQWCALYGDNLQEGVAGFGDTPELAAGDFNKAWQNSRLLREGK